MTKKQKEIALAFPLLKGKEILVYTNTQGTSKGNEPMYEGTADRSTGTYIILKHCIMWHGGWKDEELIHIGKIMRIELKNKS